MFLISLTEAKEFLQITNTATDALITTYIDMVEAEIEAYTNRSLALATYTETPKYLQSNFDQSDYTYFEAATNVPNLFLRNYPIRSLTLTVGGQTATASYIYNANNGVITINDYVSDPTVTYVAGYTTATAPNDLKAVAKMGVSSIFNNNSAAKMGSGNVTSKRIKDFSVNYGYNQNSLLSEVNNELVKTYIAGNKTILNKYRRVDL